MENKKGYPCEYLDEGEFLFCQEGNCENCMIFKNRKILYIDKEISEDEFIEKWNKLMGDK